MLELPAGRALLGVIALSVLAFGLAGILSGLRRSFMKDLDVSELPSGTAHWVRRLGTIGYPAKGLAISIIGILLGLAALQSNPGQAGGLDAALRTLAAQPSGTLLLVVVALGFAAYALFSFAAARSHRTPSARRLHQLHTATPPPGMHTSRSPAGPVTAHASYLGSGRTLSCSPLSKTTRNNPSLNATAESTRAPNKGSAAATSCRSGTNSAGRAPGAETGPPSTAQASRQ